MKAEITNFGQWMAEERVKQGLSRWQLSALAGSNYTSIYRYEMKGDQCNVQTAIRIMKALGYKMVAEDR